MLDRSALTDLLGHYPPDCRATRCEALGDAGGFSGASIARLTTPRGPLCLKALPVDYPRERLEFVQAVLWVAEREGFDLAPIPIATTEDAGYIEYRERLWELTPWMPGEADFHASPSTDKLVAALTALAWFHRATADFPIPEPSFTASPGIAGRLSRLAHWKSSGIRDIVDRVSRIGDHAFGGRGAEIRSLSSRLLRGFDQTAPRVERELRQVAMTSVRLQPCIRDIWHDHLLFVGQRVSGIVDFDAMQVDSVAVDLARLIGSLVGDDVDARRVAVAAYRQVRSLNDDEIALIDAFDHANALMSGLQWLEWLVVEHRVFPDFAKVVARMQDIVNRLERLASTPP